MKKWLIGIISFFILSLIIEVLWAVVAVVLGINIDFSNFNTRAGLIILPSLIVAILIANKFANKKIKPPKDGK